MSFLSNFADSFKPQKPGQGFEPAVFQDRKDEAKYASHGSSEKTSVQDVDPESLGQEEYSNATGIVTTERGIKLTTAETGLKRNLSTRHMQVSISTRLH